MKKHLSLALICLVLSLSSWQQQPTPAYQLQNKASGLLLRPQNASKANGAPLVIYEPYRWRCMTWDLLPGDEKDTFVFRNYFSNKTFVPAEATPLGPRDLLQAEITPGNPNQVWRLVKAEGDYYRIELQDGSGVLTVAENKKDANTQVIVKKWENSPYQLWKLLPKPERFDG